MRKKEIWHAVELALRHAKKKHPNYPDHVCAQAGIVVEEAGELMRAALQWKYERGSIKASDLQLLINLQGEALHTAAACIRFLENLKNLKVEPITDKQDTPGELPGI